MIKNLNLFELINVRGIEMITSAILEKGEKEYNRKTDKHLEQYHEENKLFIFYMHNIDVVMYR